MDLNADLGESFGHWTLGDDERLVPYLPSANLACGFHAGDFRVMEATVALCAGLVPEDMVAQSMDDCSPTKWHLAHTTWFFETFVLRAAAPGHVPFHPAFEVLFNSYYEAGDYETVIERARETLEQSGYAAPLYNLACCEALAGKKDDAIGHLRAAFELRPGLRDLAKKDSDLDPLRDEAGFRELVG